MAQTAAFADTPAAALDRGQLWTVATETGFGRAVLLRGGLFFLALFMSPARQRDHRYWRFLAGLGAVAASSFAWSGHGVRDEGLSAVVHLTADILHLLAASTWIGALAALTAFVVIARRGVDRGSGREAVAGLAKFSGIGALAVAVLLLTGLANSWFLVGPAAMPDLLTTPYGQLLAVKVLLFGGMLGLAGLNRFRHTPRLQRTLQGSFALPAVFRPVLISVLAETSLAAVVLMLVSWLGTLAPPING